MSPRPIARRFIFSGKLLLTALMAYLLLAVVGGIMIAEASLKLTRRPLLHRAAAAHWANERYQAALQEISIEGADGAILKTWYVRPRIFNGSSVILLHGIGDNREGVAGYGRLFLDHGYGVLLPDARAHGESGGRVATYGVTETDDIHRWVSWLYLHDQPHCVYGFGESYGAALMLQSLAADSRYCALAVESSFSSAREMSFERVSGAARMGTWFGRTLGRPVIWSAAVYGRLRYGVDLMAPDPLRAVARSRVPCLLIHGSADAVISPLHARRMAAAAGDHVQLWLVPGAGHTMAWSASPSEFEQRVLFWFASHRGPLKHMADAP